MLDIIAPRDAFRQMLAAGYGKATLKFAEQITDYGWFWYPESPHLKVRKGKVEKLAKIPLFVHEAMDRTWKLFRGHVREGDIGLRGELNNNPPIEIDRADRLVGEFNVFDQTLTIPGQGGRPARTYRRVFCIKEDVMKIVERISKDRPGLAQRDWPPIESKAQPALKPAPDSQVRAEIGAVYDEADKDKNAPRPNIAQLPGVVRPRLEARSLVASGRQIKKIGGEDRFKRRRRARGQIKRS
jgi:hypothetical protein